MTLLMEWLPENERRLLMDSTLGFGKRAAKHDSGLCLVCGRRATGRCSKCAIATFCGPQCQEAARATHAGAVTTTLSCCTAHEKGGLHAAWPAPRHQCCSMLRYNSICRTLYCYHGCLHAQH